MANCVHANAHGILMGVKLLGLCHQFHGVADAVDTLCR